MTEHDHADVDRHVRAALFVFGALLVLTGFTVGAYYNDRLVRTEQGWRIAERIEETAFLEGSLPEALKIPS